MYAYNTHIHKSTGYSPYELLFGNKAYIPSTITQEPSINYAYDDYVKNLRQKLNLTQKLARENIITNKEKSKINYDKKLIIHQYAVGDLVYLKSNQNTPGTSKKLSPNFNGPYEITKVNSNNTVDLKIKNKEVTYHKNLLRPAHL